jgi:hypothetical protein
MSSEAKGFNIVEVAYKYHWIVLFILYISFVIVSGGAVNSPDEAANLFFIEQLRATGSFAYIESLNEIAGNLVHPRSTTVIGDMILPGTFLGFPFLIGLLTTFLPKIFTFILPVLVVSCIGIGVYHFMKAFVPKNIARISALLIGIHPAMWFYASKAMMHNALFITLLTLSASLFLSVEKKPAAKKEHRLAWQKFFLSGLLVTSALFIRTNEIVWTVPLFAIFLWFQRERLSLRMLLWFALGAGSMGVVMFNVNQEVFGTFLTGGYTQASNTVTAIAGQATAVEVGIMTRLKDLVMYALFPFGIDIKHSLKMGYYYLAYLFPVTFSAALAGVALLAKKKIIGLTQDDFVRLKRYFVTGALLSVYLVIYYGSWKFHDHPDPNAVSIGTSYVRYWLPLYIFSIPFIAFFIDYVASFFSTMKDKVTIGLVLIFAVYSGYFVWFKTDESLINVMNAIHFNSGQVEQMLPLVSSDAIVVTDSDDKFIFPHRAVMMYLREDHTLDQIQPLLEAQKLVYYYGLTLPQQDMVYLNSKKLLERGLKIQLVQTFENKSLYQFSNAPNNEKKSSDTSSEL